VTTKVDRTPESSGSEETSAVSDEQIDAILEGSDDKSAGDSESGHEGTDDLSQRLQTIGLRGEDIPDASNLTPEQRDVINKIASKADERIRGMQSGFSKLDNELRAKADTLDRLLQMPKFKEMMGEGDSGEEPAGQEFSLKNIDLSQLPSDPEARAEAIIKMGAKSAVGPDIQGLGKQIDQLKQLMGNMVWENFKTAHPDAEQGSQEISQLVKAGMDLNKAYRTWKAMNVDPDSIREETLQAVRKRMQEKKRAAGVPISEHSKGTGTSPADAARVNEMAEKQGDRKTFMSILAERAEELGM